MVLSGLQVKVVVFEVLLLMEWLELLYAVQVFVKKNVGFLNLFVRFEVFEDVLFPYVHVCQLEDR